MLANFEKLQHTQVQLRLRSRSQRISFKIEWARRLRNGTTAVRIKASERVDRPAASNCQNRSRFDIPEQLGDCPGRLFALVLISEREIESPAEHEPVPLVVGR